LLNSLFKSKYLPYDIQPSQLYTQAGLISRQGYVPQKQTRKSNTDFPLKTAHFLEVRRLKTQSYTMYDYTASGQPDLKSTYILYIWYTYISIQFIYVFIIE